MGTSNYFLNFGKKIYRTKPALLSNPSHLPIAAVKSPLSVRSSLKAGPETSRKEPPDSAMARGVMLITGQGFQIVLSRSSVEEAIPFISALGVLVLICRNFKRRNEGEDFFYGASKQNNLESPPRDWPAVAGH
jgi:hypothetical protein